VAPRTTDPIIRAKHLIHHQKHVPTGQLGDLIGKPTGVDRPVRHSLMDGSTGHQPGTQPPSEGFKNKLNSVL